MTKLNPNSYNLSLGNELIVYEEDILDCKKENKTRIIKIPEEGYILQPGEFYLAKTMEYTETYKNVPILNGRSSIGRVGLAVHISAGCGDAGFKGAWTLSLYAMQPVKVYPGMRICQICYYPLIGSDRIKYHGKYANNGKVNVSKMEEDFNEIA
jgi:dCTP deaminase